MERIVLSPGVTAHLERGLELLERLTVALEAIAEETTAQHRELAGVSMNMLGAIGDLMGRPERDE